MKTISRLTRAWIVLGLALGTCHQLAGASPLTTPWLSMAAVAQAGERELTPEDRRRRAAELITAARQSMKVGKWDAAESQLSRAEELDANFGVLHFGDTPKKVRQDLERARAKANAPEGMMQRLSPFRKNKTEAAENPFAGRAGSQADAAAPRNGKPAGAKPAADEPSLTARRPAAGRKSFDDPSVPAEAMPRLRTPGAGAIPAEQVFGDEPALPADAQDIAAQPTRKPARRTAEAEAITEPADDDVVNVEPKHFAADPADPAAAKKQSDALLLASRRALARGDVRRARGLADQAQALGVRYTLAEDTPAKLVAAIDRQQSLLDNRGRNGDSESYRREQSEFMMEQAEALLHWHDYDEAERLAQDVGRLGVEFGPFDAHPQALLERIAAARRAVAAGEVPQATAGLDQDLTPAGSDAVRMAKVRSMQLVAAARAALGVGDLRQAEKLARQAEGLRVPDGMYAADDDRPNLVLMEIQRARGNQATVAGGVQPAGPDNQVGRAVYDPRRDPTRNVAASGEGAAQAQGPFDFPANGPLPSPGGEGPAAGTPAIVPPQSAVEQAVGKPLRNQSPEAANADLEQALALIERGEKSLQGGDRNTAVVYFRQAGAFSDALPPDVRQRLDGHLAQLDNAGPSQPLGEAIAAPAANPTADAEFAMPPLPPAGQPAGSLLDRATAEQQVAVKQIHAQVSRRLAESRRLRESDDPKQAIQILKELKTTVDGATTLDAASRQQYALRIDKALAETERYLEINRGQIELREQSAATKAQVDREQQVKVEVDNRLAAMVEEFNQLMDDRRFHEADIIARKAEEMDPANPIVQQLKWVSRFSRRELNSTGLRDDKEAAFVDTMNSVEQASKPFNDQNPIEFPPIRDWDKLTRRRTSMPADEPRRNERELEIIRKLRTPVSLQFEDAALSEVLNYLAKLAEINLHLDPQGLSEEGVTTDTPVTIDLNQEISLKSALNLILEPLHLSYIIKDEVLKVTSEQFRDGNIVPKTYPVADLVIPIPNFVPGPKMGMAGALAEAYNTLGYSGAPGYGGGMSPMTVVASRDGTPNSAMINPQVLAQTQLGGSRDTLAGALSGATQPIGPGGAGGGAAADYDSLIRLITTTIAPTTWDEVGGSGAISPFRGNLSLVISNTEEVHDQIRDLLQQLRRLQDLQVTIEVRFITLNDNFFERIGIDFDFDINSNIDKPFQIFGRTDPNVSTSYTSPPFLAGGGPARDVQDRNLNSSNSVSVGLTAPNVFSTDMDIPFRQDSFTLAVPQFGGFDPGAGASFGFAILSDIETYFFLNAAQGDRRSNVLQAPKVTLFNGQQASVSDQTQTPFVISVIPVVGDFAAAQQPVIIILSEGTFMTVQAVVSSDRRFVRLTVVPFFSSIGDVDTFTFSGSSTTTESTSSDGKVDDTTARDQERTTITEGTTVQLPTFAFVSVTTTVSVPDGGTVLLGGIKRLSEGRSEFGVPILNKLPYVSRLFKNVGIGRETESLMMMVTPRIIIQEEEESLLGLNPSPATTTP